MTEFEEKLAALNLNWVRTDNAFTTVHQGFGLVVFCQETVQLTVLSREIVAKLLKIHKTIKPPRIAGIWKHGYDTIIEGMFKIPVTPAFLAIVLESAFPNFFQALGENHVAISERA